MLRPTFSALRTVPGSSSRSKILRYNVLGRRRLHAESQSQKVSNTAIFLGGGVVSFGAVLAYRLTTAETLDVHAETLPPAKLSAQHTQLTTSLENPGVYAWGDNTGKVVAPKSKEKVIKTPRRLVFFDNILLRDLKICQDSGVAVNDEGDVLQWGTGYAPDVDEPEVTLKGKNIEKIVMTKDKIIALSKDKTIFSFPTGKGLQLKGVKPTESSWIPGMSSEANISYKVHKPGLGFMETIQDVASGRDHILVLTSSGRLFSAAASFQYPAKGQLGISGLTWATRPQDKPYDVLHEVKSLQGHKIKQIAAGDYHSVALDSNGEVWSFGDNLNGQLGFEYNMDTNVYDEPKQVELASGYPPKTFPKVTKIAAGGLNSYFVVEANEPVQNRTTVDVLACGTGIHGNLGNGRWKHIQGNPTKISALSGLFEFNERANKLNPIRIRDFHVGATHTVAIMANDTRVDASASSSDVNYGSDVMWWGNNEHYQLGTGKRNNSNVPVYIPALDPSVSAAADSSFAGHTFTGSATKGGSPETQRASGIIGGVDRDDSGMFSGNDQVHRFQLTPPGKTKSGKKAEQAIVCGHGNTAVFMKYS